MITAQLINHRKRRSQHGQAMVEYAILLVVAFLFMFGAAELTSAGFNSYKTSEGAKAGATEYLSAKTSIQRYTRPLAAEINLLEGTLNIAEGADGTPPDVGDLDNNGTPDKFEHFLNMLAESLSLLPTDPPSDRSIVFDINYDGKINRDDLTIAVLELAIDGEYPNLIPENPVGIPPELAADIYAQKLNLLEKQIEKLEEEQLQLADHDPASNNQISSAQCVGNEYDDGLGGRYVDPEKYPEYFEEGVTNQIYLFNPLPIDSETCVGKDETRDNRSRISILVGGYYKPPPADQNLNVPGLPKLNQAMYSQYTKVCLEGNDYVLDPKQECLNGIQLLKPPGKLCLADDADSEGCPGVDNDSDRPISGYYFFGGDTTPEIAPEFRPTFQIECNQEGFAQETVMSSSCREVDGTVIGPDSTTNRLTNIRVHTRYRYVFDSFVPFGAAEMSSVSQIPYYYNPGRMGKSGSNNLVGAPGSELGPVGDGIDTGDPDNANDDVQLPTIKPFRDFRGCHEVDLSTNQISACN